MQTGVELLGLGGDAEDHFVGNVVGQIGRFGSAKFVADPGDVSTVHGETVSGTFFSHELIQVCYIETHGGKKYWFLKS